MELSIEQTCPSCGAPIIVTEDTRLIRCDFCSVHNYRCGNSPGRYILPLSPAIDVDEDQMIFVPYLRFKGSVFSVWGEQIQHKIVDTTRLGLGGEGKGSFPLSLGLRPQTLKLRPVTKKLKGKFLQQTVPTRDAFVHATGILGLFKKDKNRKKTTYHRAFIGETISTIYQPCFARDNTLWDGVLGREMGPLSLGHELGAKVVRDKHNWEPRYISTFCPCCGGLLAGGPNSVVLNCTNCSRHWQEGNGSFTEIAWGIESSAPDNASFLPFWRVSCTVEGQKLESFGDFIRFTNQPIALSARYDNRLLIFVVPAFKIRPETFLQLAARLTVSQPRLGELEPQSSFQGYPVTLPQDEALQMIKTVIAATTLSREMRYPLLPSLRIKNRSTSLSYLPFVKKHYHYIHPGTGASLQVAALQYGSTL